MQTRFPSAGLASCLALCFCLALPAHAQQARRTATAASRQYPSTGAIGDAYFSIDPETRRVVTIADEETSQYIAQVLQNLDSPKPQVLIKVVFVEVAHTKASDIGIEGGYGKSFGNDTSGGFANAFGMSALGSVAGSNGSPVNVFGQSTRSFAPIPPGAGVYQVLGEDFQVTLRAIAQAGNAKVLSRPSILARNNQPATITVGQSVPLITSVRYDNFGNAINSVEYEDVGVILRVTPFITQDGMVQMIISPKISSINPTFSIPISADVNAPVIDVRSADTVAVTPDRQTVIIGGLMSNTKSVADSKIPILGDIPILGALFRRRQTDGSNTELLIFLTPYIVAAPGDLPALSEAERLKSDTQKDFTEQELRKFLDNLPAKEPSTQAAPKQNKSRQ
jgi:general secretion pathway protein D